MNFAKSQANQVGIMETVSPPRVTPRAQEYGFGSDTSYDLTYGWGARKSDDLDTLLRDIEDRYFYIVVMTLPCRNLSPLQNLTPWELRKGPEKFTQEVKE